MPEWSVAERLAAAEHRLRVLRQRIRSDAQYSHCLGAAQYIALHLKDARMFLARGVQEAALNKLRDAEGCLANCIVPQAR